MISNPEERHLACILLVDVSGSMIKDNAIGKLNEALQDFKKALLEDELVRATVDVSIVSFSAEVKIEVPFTPAKYLEIPELKAYGMSAMNEAIMKGLDLVEERKDEYRNLGIPYLCPWIFLMTDGAGTDDEYVAEAKNRIRQAVEAKKVIFFPLAIGPNADAGTLKEYNNDGKVLKASTDLFKQAFQWLSYS